MKLCTRGIDPKPFGVYGLAFLSGVAMPKRRITVGADVPPEAAILAMGVPTNKTARITNQFGTEASRSRGQITRMSLDLFEAVKRTDTLELIDGTMWEFCYIDPLKYLQEICKRNGDVCATIAAAITRHPPSEQRPWSVIYGFDEAYSGNPFRHSGRKFMALSYSFAELGATALSSSSSWFTCVVVQSRTLRLIPGGWSHLLARVVRAHLNSEDGLARGGSLLQVYDKTVVLFGKVHNLLCDGDGWRVALQAKGASGLKCCALCKNVVQDGHGLDNVNGLVTTACSDSTKFRQHTQETLDSLIRKVTTQRREWEQGRATKASLLEMQKAAGYSPDPFGIWGDPSDSRLINVAETLVVDWVHCALIDGCFSLQLDKYISIIEEVTMEGLCNFLATWTLAGTNDSSAGWLKKLKMLVKQRSASGWERPSASDLLDFVGVLRCWIEGHADTSEKQSFLRSAELACAIQRAKYQPDFPSIDSNADRIDECWRSYMLALAPEMLKPKCHWIAHVSPQFRKFKQIVDTLIIERIHRRVKKHSAAITNCATFERTTLQKVFISHCLDTRLETATLFSGCADEWLALSYIMQPQLSTLMPPSAVTRTTLGCIAGPIRFVRGEFIKHRDGTMARAVCAAELAALHITVVVQRCLAQPEGLGGAPSITNALSILPEYMIWEPSCVVASCVAWQFIEATQVYLVMSPS